MSTRSRRFRLSWFSLVALPLLVVASCYHDACIETPYFDDQCAERTDLWSRIDETCASGEDCDILVGGTDAPEDCPEIEDIDKVSDVWSDIFRHFEWDGEDIDSGPVHDPATDECCYRTFSWIE